MTAVIVAAHFLTAALLTMLIPIGLLVIVGIYWAVLLHHRATGARTGKVD
jgi:hypothetical protein